MTNKEAAKILKVRDEKRMKQLFGPKFAQAILLGIAALESPLLAVDYKKEGAKGGAAQKKKFSRRQMTNWGKMGGRPKNKAA